MEKEWSGSLCPKAPDTCWIDDETGEHVCAVSGARTARHPGTDDVERQARLHYRFPLGRLER
jgi:hypothetical protein